MPRFLIVYDTEQGERSEILVGSQAALQDQLEHLAKLQPAGSRRPIWAQVTNQVKVKSHGSKRR